MYAVCTIQTDKPTPAEFKFIENNWHTSKMHGSVNSMANKKCANTAPASQIANKLLHDVISFGVEKKERVYGQSIDLELTLLHRSHET